MDRLECNMGMESRKQEYYRARGAAKRAIFKAKDAERKKFCEDLEGEHRRSQHEARGGNCLLLNFQIDNDFSSCFASSNKKMIKISTNYHKIVFVLQRCTTKTIQQRCSIQKFPRG